jgi:5-oxopent-3-ene-1,2,5-tricarboxylate decarboxylase / 2-hydroxyhepta-2,4-diene-1,7-dioate isomerase
VIEASDLTSVREDTAISLAFDEPAWQRRIEISQRPAAVARQHQRRRRHDASSASLRSAGPRVSGCEKRMHTMSSATESIDLERLARIPVATLTQVLQQRGRRHTFVQGLHALDPEWTMAGRARTLRCLPNRAEPGEVTRDVPNTPKLRVIESIQPGEVLVIDAGGDLNGGQVGDILCVRIKQLGGAGVVIDGGVRDTPQVRDVGLPIWVRGSHGGNGYRALYDADYDLPVRCGGVTVIPGDYVVADGDGVVVIPPELIAEVMASASEIEQQEDFIREKIMAGHTTTGVYPPDEATLREFEKWRQSRSG